MNASHVLLQVLGAVLPQDGSVPEPLRAGIVRPSDEEIESWSALEPGSEVARRPGRSSADPRAAEEFYLRTCVEPAVDVHGVSRRGAAAPEDGAIRVEAEANVSIRLVPGQDERRSPRRWSA